MAFGRDYLGTYRLVRMIRAGQTCQVWEAVTDVDNRRVALKMLQPELRHDRQEVGYLRHEFDVAKEFHHPNVVEVYAFNTEREIPFLVMEFVSGRNIKLMLRSGPDLLAPMASKVIEQAAVGLAYLHDQGWIHRDIKPDNFLITDDWDVKLIDFALSQRTRSGLGKFLGGRTKVQGTRSYMSPEQIRGKGLDVRSDLYSFGCMLYEMLSGKMPFTGTSPEDLLQKHLSAPIPAIMAANRNITPEFNDVVARLMAKDPADRPASIQDFLKILQGTRIYRVTPRASTESRTQEEAYD